MTLGVAAGHQESARDQRLARRAAGALQGLPVVAVIGRPNVGKSMLVNRLAETFRDGAIVEDVVGITRDRTYRLANWQDALYQVVDTGGLVFDEDPQLTFITEIREQALTALDEADAVLLVVDGQAGLNPLDTEIADFLRRQCPSQTKVFVVVNKCEQDEGELLAAEFWTLGLGNPYPVSAIHGTGTGDLLDELIIHIPRVTPDDVAKEEQTINVAIVGKPNVGKSSLLNRFAGVERAIVSDIPGTTRDTVDDIIERNGQTYRLLDTAGIRRKKAVNYGTEFFMINRAFKAIRRSDVVMLVVDIMEGISEQETRLAERIAEEGRACIIVVNKWDLVPDKDNDSHKIALEYASKALRTIPWARPVVVSAVTGQRLPALLDAVDDAVRQHRRRVTTSVLNEVLKEAVEWHKPTTSATLKTGRIYYCTQVAIRPPTIAMFVNDAKLFKDNYKRYIEGQFRKALGLEGTPLRILWRSKGMKPSSGTPYGK